MKTIVITLFKFSLKIIYFFLKLLPTNNKKIVFISRQSNDINIDFKMIKEEINKKDKTIKMIFICKRIEKGLLNYIKYYFSILKQTYHLATSKLCIIDSYSIPVCILKHKRSLKVIQIWHSIGKIKKSGYQTLDKKSGRSSKIAKLMCMHKNYDVVIAGGKAFNKFYQEGFNIKEDVLLNYGLPRIDYLINNEQKLRNKIYKKYPEFKNKKIVYYVPTFRTYDIKGQNSLMNEYKKYKKDFILIVRGHPNQKLEINNNDIYECNEFKSTDLLSVADYVITDYSSISLEAAVLNKKVLFYLYDYEKYLKENGINLDPYKTVPSLSSKNIKEIFNKIKNDEYDNETYQKFRKNYLPEKLGESTNLIADYIINSINKR